MLADTPTAIYCMGRRRFDMAVDRVDNRKLLPAHRRRLAKDLGCLNGQADSASN